MALDIGKKKLTSLGSFSFFVTNWLLKMTQHGLAHDVSAAMAKKLSNSSSVFPSSGSLFAFL
jgi:hypothetical protein